MAAIAGVVGASWVKLYPDAGILVSLGIIFATAVGVGTVCGAVNGFLYSKIKYAPLYCYLSDDECGQRPGICPDRCQTGLWASGKSFGWLGLRKAGPIPVSIILMLFVIIISFIILSKTCFGRYIYAIGSNREVAKLTGISVLKIRFSVYMISGILSALAGLVLASKLQNGQATAASGYELNAIAAVAMGGTSMSGGRGGIAQTVIGLIVIGIINNALSLLGVSSYWQTVSMGVIILAAVIIDQFRK